MRIRSRELDQLPYWLRTSAFAYLVSITREGGLPTTMSAA